jgi:hypothetical protein
MKSGRVDHRSVDQVRKEVGEACAAMKRLENKLRNMAQ